MSRNLSRWQNIDWQRPEFHRTFPVVDLLMPVRSLTHEGVGKKERENAIANPWLFLPEVPNLCCKMEHGYTGMPVLQNKWSSLNGAELPVWISRVYQHQHTLALAACTGLRKKWLHRAPSPDSGQHQPSGCAWCRPVGKERLTWLVLFVVDVWFSALQYIAGWITLVLLIWI